jgi:RNA polymerase sigma factor (sigma-70 family)
MRILPQAGDLQTLDRLMETLALGISDRHRLADRLGVRTRTIRQYIELARWLGLLSGSGGHLTETGRRYVGDASARRAILRHGLSSQPLVQALRQRSDWRDRPVERAVQLIRSHSTLSESTARRRAQALVRLLEHASLMARRERPISEIVETSLPGAADVPLAILGASGALRRVLARLGASVVRELMELSEADLRRADLSERRQEQVRQLQERARALEEADDAPAVDVARSLVDYGIDLEDDWRETLVRLPTRAASGFDRGAFETVGQVLSAWARGDLTDLAGVGEGTAEEVSEHLELIAQQGYETYRYGPGGRPETATDLADRMLDTLEPADRRILEMRYQGGMTFGEIGDAYDLTRQRIRQKTNDYLQSLREKFGAVADEMIAPLADELSGGIHLIHRSHVRRLCGGEDLFRVLLVLLMSREEAYIWQDHFIATVPASMLKREHGARFRRMVADSRRYRLPMALGLEYAEAVGFRFDEEALRDYLREAWNQEVDSRGTFANLWANKGDRIAYLLEQRRQPVDLEEIARLYDAQFADGDEAAATPRRVQPFVKKHPHIFTVENGLYIHRSALPVSDELLEEVVGWCVQRLRGESRAVSVSVLLDELAESDFIGASQVECLNRYLLRDMLLRDPGVTGFHNTFNVAWKESFEFEGVTLLDRVETILKAADGTLEAEEVIDRLPDDFDVNPHSVENYLVSEDFSIRVDEQAYLHRDNLDLTRDAQTELVEAAVDVLPGDGTVMSAQQIVEELRGDARVGAFPERDGAAGILWGLLRHDERVEAGNRWLVARRDEADETLLERAILDIVEKIGPTYPREIDQGLEEEFGFDVRESRVYRRARELADRGELRRFPNGLYFPAGLSDAEVFALLDERSEDLRRAARRADVAKYPRSDLWLLARYLSDAEHLEEALLVLDELIGQASDDEGNTEWEELRREVESRRESGQTA